MKARPWVRAARLGAALLALATVLSAGRAEAVPPDSADKPVPAAPASATFRTVTLVTGDRVVVNMQGKQSTVVNIVPGPGRSHVSFATLTVGGRLRVIPADAMPLIRANRLDPRLFDVTALVQFGYDDRGKDLPVLMLGPAVTAASANTARAAARTAAAATAMRNVPGGAAFHVAKSSTGAFWRSFAASAASGTVKPNTPAPKLWLDAVRQVSLKDSVPQIGAPAAWAAGFTGAGVIVGVVDTGIDSNHPDLAGRVIAAQDFTGDNDTRDLVGHGTHVAATIASVDSVFRGVAHDAHLVSAKACDDLGCSDSSILAAIQYAVDNGAKIINMSLGGLDTPGTDPLEADVNQLTAQDNVLFCVAAGNDGLPASIESPGSADAALTVGAVDKSDQLADFSSMGPRLGDDAIKPDITAPGVDITAARSADGEFGNPGDLRVSLSGTSMATPHVAGSAAILLQEHPTWGPAQLKAALMGSALRNTDLNPFQQGAGRVNVAHEINQAVLADPPSVSFATEVFPHSDDTPDARAVTYRNTSASPVTLQLSLDDSAPAGMFTLSASSVTVPANGSASVDLTSDTNLDVPDDHYTGYLMAQTPTGTISTPFAVFKEPKSSTVTFHYLDRAGQPTQDASGVLIDPNTGEFVDTPGDGGSMRLRDGTYAYVAQLFDEDGSTSMLAEPALTIDADRDLTADARDAKPVTISVPFAGAQGQLLEAAVQIDTPAGPASVIAFGFGTPLYIGAADPAVTAPYVSSVIRDDFLVPPRPGADPTDDVAVMYHRLGRLYDGFTRTVKRSDLATFPVEYATDRHGDALMLTRPFWPDLADSPLATGFRVILPARRTEYLNVNEGVRWRRELIVQDAATGTLDYLLFSPFGSFRGGHVYPERRNAPVFGPGFQVPAPGTSYVPPISRQGDTLNVVPTVANDRLDWLESGLADAAAGSTTVALSRNGQQLASQPTGFDLDVPPGNATYQVSIDESRGGADTVSTSIHADWTFHSDTTATTSFAAIPVPAVRFTPDLSLTDTAPTDRPLIVPVDVQNEPTASPSAVRSLTVQVSYDDGVTWHNVVLAGTGAHRLAVIPSPSSGFVSLRATATNAAGNSVSETIIRAYGVA